MREKRFKTLDQIAGKILKGKKWKFGRLENLTAEERKVYDEWMERADESDSTWNEMVFKNVLTLWGEEPELLSEKGLRLAIAILIHLGENPAVIRHLSEPLQVGGRDS